MKNKMNTFLNIGRKTMFVSALWLSSVGLFAQLGGYTDKTPFCEDFTCGDNLVINGDFEDGNTGFSSDYRLTPRPCCCATYAIHYNAYAFHPTHWWTRDDHTIPDLNNDPYDEDGLFFIGDAQCELGGKKAWYQNVEVDAGFNYLFEAWVSNLDDKIYSNRAVFTIDVDGVLLMEQGFVINSLGKEDSDNRWSKICGEFLSTVSGTVRLSINVYSSLSSNPGLMGADFGLDDVSFKVQGPGEADFEVVRSSDCPNDFIAFSPSTVIGVHHWDYGNGLESNTIQGSTIYTSPGTYTVTHTISIPGSNCVQVFTVDVVVSDACGTPKCEQGLGDCSANLATNGDFEAGDSGFETDLFPIANDTPAEFGECGGRYTVETSAAAHSGTDFEGSTWDLAADHTSGNGKFMIADQPCTSDGAVLWENDISVVTGGVYNFTAWIANISPETNQPSVILRANGDPVSEPNTILYSENTEDKWVKICGTFTSSETGNVTFRIDVAASADAATSADLGLDDISIVRQGTADANFSASNQASRYCSGVSIQFAATQQTGNHQWKLNNWSYSNGSSTKNYTLNAGTYTIWHKVTDEQTGCQDERSLEIVVENCCEVNPNFTATPDDDPNGTGACSFDFTDISTFSPETGSIDNWLWTMEDADGTVTSYNTQHTSHNFNSGGPHQVCLEIQGRAGNQTCEDVICQEITSPCNLDPCVIYPGFTFEETDYKQGLAYDTKELTFTNTTTTSNGAAVTSFIWSFITVDPSEQGNASTEAGKETDVSRYFDMTTGFAEVELIQMGQNGPITCDASLCKRIDLTTLAESDCQILGQTGTIPAFIKEDQLNAYPKVSVYPNPAQKQVNVRLELNEDSDVEITVSNPMGTLLNEKIYQQHLTNGLHTLTLDISDLDKGIYILHVLANHSIKEMLLEIH
jgi:hypothetical protein